MSNDFKNNISNNIDNIKQSGKLDKILIKQKIHNYLIGDIDKIMLWRKRWYSIKSISELLSLISVFLVTILSFGSSYYKTDSWGFFNGLIGVIGIALKQLSAFAKKNAKKKNDQINRMLHDLHIEQNVPDITSIDNSNRHQFKKYHSSNSNITDNTNITNITNDTNNTNDTSDTSDTNNISDIINNEILNDNVISDNITSNIGKDNEAMEINTKDD
jgi:hypothetical protein